MFWNSAWPTIICNAEAIIFPHTAFLYAYKGIYLVRLHYLHTLKIVNTFEHTQIINEINLPTQQSNILNTKSSQYTKIYSKPRLPYFYKKLRLQF